MTLPRKIHNLAPQEVSILRKIAEGLRDSDIAADLFLAPGTVRASIERIRNKTGVDSRLRLVIYAYEEGYVVPRYVESLAR